MKVPGKAKGRPRQFDAEKALDRAVKVFWRYGYEGASLQALTKAMRINRPSLYSAFGDKESLFRKAVDRYMALHACRVEAALSEPTAEAVVRRLWADGIELVSRPSGPQGCMLVQSALTCGAEARSVQRELSKRRQLGEAALRERFARAVDEGDLPPTVDAAALARFVAAVSYGLAVQAASGASREELEAIAAIALEGWPKRSRRAGDP